MQCSTVGRTRKVALRGLCRRCYDELPDKRPYVTGPIEDRMAQYTNKDGDCWLWTGALTKGYGRVWIGPREGVRDAHIVAWELEHGESARGRVVRHTCDTPRCVRPSHLLIGTHADNVADKVNRGRSCVGSKHGLSHLAEGDVLEIRRLASMGISQAVIGTRFGVGQSTVSMIVNRKTWTHI